MRVSSSRLGSARFVGEEEEEEEEDEEEERDEELDSM